MNRAYFLLWILLFSLIQSAHAVNYGSDSTVSIVNPFAISGDGNAIRTFGCVKNGFQLTDANTTCSFYSIFPVAGPHTQEQRSLLRLANQSSRLYCDHCTLELPDYGMQLTKGTILFDNKVTINGNTAAIDEQHSLEFGDGTSNNDAYIDILSGANIVVNGYMYYHPATA